jgi:hypothetical protein
LDPNGGGTTILEGERVGVPHSDDCKESLALGIFCNDSAEGVIVFTCSSYRFLKQRSLL